MPDNSQCSVTTCFRHGGIFSNNDFYKFTIDSDREKSLNWLAFREGSGDRTVASFRLTMAGCFALPVDVCLLALDTCAP